MDEAIKEDKPAQPVADKAPATPVKPKSPEAAILVEHSNWLLDTVNNWAYPGAINEIKGRLLIMRDVANKLP